jgi:hypothetical protein
MTMSCHAYVMPMSSLCHPYVMPMSCLHHVMPMSCLCHAYVMPMSSLCHAYVMSSLCHAYVMPMSCLCHAYVMPMSCHAYVMPMSCLCHAYQHLEPGGKADCTAQDCQSFDSVFDTFSSVATRSAMPCRPDEEFTQGPDEPNPVSQTAEQCRGLPRQV